MFELLLGLCLAAASPADADTDSAEPPVGGAAGNLQLTVDEAVALALRQNFDIRNAFVARLSQRYALYVAHDKVRPHVGLTAAAGHTWAVGPETIQTAAGDSVTVTPHAELLLPTGALLSVDLQEAYTRPPAVGPQPYASGLVLNVSQPLLKDAGIEVTRASIDLAESTDQVNRLTLKNQVLTTVNSVIVAYRAFTQSSVLMDIARNAVTRSRELLDINHQMVTAGRIAKADLIQVESEIATREVNLANQESDYVAQQIALLQLLAMRADTPVTPVPEAIAPQAIPSPEEARERALAERPDYLIGLANKQVAALNLMVAENERQWDLRVTAEHRRGDVTAGFGRFLAAPVPGPSHSTFVGLTLSVPVLDVLLEQRVVDSRVSFAQAEITASQLRNTVGLDIDGALRDLALRERIYGLARRARALAEKKLANEREKLGAGRSSNFVVLRFVDDLVNAEVAELNTSIAYLNAATTLQVKLGTLLDAWDIRFD